MVQWLRARFNECYEKAEWAKARCADELPFVDRLVHDEARETVRLLLVERVLLLNILSRGMLQLLSCKVT